MFEKIGRRWKWLLLDAGAPEAWLQVRVPYSRVVSSR